MTIQQDCSTSNHTIKHATSNKTILDFSANLKETIADNPTQVNVLTKQVTMLNELTSNYENTIARQQSEINSINGVIEGLQQWLNILSKDICRHETMVSTVSFYLTQVGAMPAKEAYRIRDLDSKYLDKNENERGY